MTETLNDFVSGHNRNNSAIGTKTLELQTNGISKTFGTITVDENGARQDHIIENNIDDKIKKAVDNCQKSNARLYFDSDGQCSDTAR